MLFALNELAGVYKRTGQHGGKPVYADLAVAFRCRTQPISKQDAGANGYAGEADTRVFAPADTDVSAGDRILFSSSAGIVVEVHPRHGFSGKIHHLEVLTRREG